MEQAHILGFLALGAIVLATVWLPVVLQRFPLSLPMVALAFGYVFFSLSPMGRFTAEERNVAEILLEFVLVVAVMGAGLKIDRPFGFRAWASTWRLLGPGMLLTIAGIAIAAIVILDLPPPLALLLGSILSPTDPVLASSVQLGPPGAGEEGEVRFALTSEAGLNDGLAFPFVTLSLLWAGAPEPGWLTHWFLVELIWKLLAAVAVGLVVGGGIMALNHRLPAPFRISRSKNAYAALGVGLLVYGLAEWAHANGFVAVFVAAATIRNMTRNLDYTRTIHGSEEQIEQLVMVLVLILFGGSVAEGLIGPLSVSEIVFATMALVVVRPVAVLVGFAGSREPFPVRAATGFFGIRGLGTLYYATYAAERLSHDAAGQLWHAVGLVVLMSVFLYGLSATPVMRRLDTLRLRTPSSAE